MPSRKTPPRGPGYPGASSAPVSSERELIVVAKPQAGLRATSEMVASIAGADVASLNSVLSKSGATLVPLFGNEDRVARAMSAGFAGADAAGLPDLPSYYRVVADDEKQRKRHQGTSERDSRRRQ